MIDLREAELKALRKEANELREIANAAYLEAQETEQDYYNVLQQIWELEDTEW